MLVLGRPDGLELGDHVLQEEQRAVVHAREPGSEAAGEAELVVLRDDIGIATKDAHTLVYTLTQPNPSFLNLLALWTAFPVRQDIVEKFGDTWTEAETHVGNGAFMLSEWTHGEKLVLQPNPYWFGEAPSLAAHFVIAPLGMLAAALPLPLGALGAFEAALAALYVAVPGDVRLTQVQGLLVAFGYRAITILIAMIGVGVWLTSRRQVAEAAAEAEADPLPA